MHYLPVLVFASVFKISLICALGGPRQAWAFAKDFFTIGEDHWTWTTQSGEWYEDAEIEAIEHGQLVLKHRYGMARLTLDALSEQSRRLLVQTQTWADYLASIPAEEKITPFRLEPMAIEAA